MALTSVSPIDGRYEGKTKCLQGYFSEMALMRYRIYTEINYLIKLLETPMLKSRVKTSVDAAKLRSIIEITEEDAKCIERFFTEKDRYITITFCEKSGDKLVTKGTYAKMARGEMVRYMAEKQIENPTQIQGFDRLGYVFREELSSESEYVFERVNS